MSTIEIKPLHFVFAIIAFYFVTSAIAHTKVEHMPSQEKGIVVQQHHDLRLPEGKSLVFIYEEDSELCKKVRYNFESLAKEHQQHSSFLEVNLYEHPEYHQLYNISGTPCILLLDNGKEIKRILGVTSLNNMQRIWKEVYGI